MSTLPTPPNSSSKLKRARDDESAVDNTQRKKHRLETQASPSADLTSTKTEPRRGIKRSRGNESDSAEIKRPRHEHAPPLEELRASSSQFTTPPTLPLAFKLKSKSVYPQYQCPFLDRLPKSVREVIYEYALTDSTAPNRLNSPNLSSSSNAYALLRTCQAVYLETFKLPMQLMTLQLYGLDRPIIKRIAPWQFALIQSLQINLSQNQPRSSFKTLVTGWRDKVRTQSGEVARHLLDTGNFESPGSLTASFYLDRSLPVRPVPTYGAPPGPKENWCTHLTLRLNRDDWRNAHCNPRKNLDVEELAFDPAIFHERSVNAGTKNSPYTIHDMLFLDEARRKGRTPEQEKESVSAVLFSIASLQTLDIVLETYAAKRAQLDRVVACAKRWTFPIMDTRERLTWTGRISEEEGGGNTTHSDTEMEVVEERDGVTTRSSSSSSTDPLQDWRAQGVVVRTLRYKLRPFSKQRGVDVLEMLDITSQLQETCLMDVDGESPPGSLIVDHGRDADAAYLAQRRDDDEGRERWRRGVELRRR